MRRVRLLVLSLVAWSLGVHFAANPPAAQEAKVPRVGLIANDEPGPTFDLLRDSFAKFGYAEGRNIVIEARFAHGQLDRVPQLTAELVSLNVDVVVALGAVGVRGTRQASATIPIVFVGSLDPVAAGFAATLERPGGSATGIVSFDPQQATKQLQILKELLPGLTRVAILSDQDVPRVDGWSSLEKTNDTAARALGVQPQILRIKGPTPDLEGAFTKMKNEHAEALLVLDSPINIIQQKRIADLAAEHRLPTMFLGGRRMSNAGGLIAYGTGLLDLIPRIPEYVDKILKGAKPGDLPIQVVNRHILIINLKTAGKIGTTVPPELLKRADQVIE